MVHPAELVRQTLWLAVLLSLPPVAAGTLAGLVTGLLGASVHVQDPAAAHVPRMLAVAAVLAVLGATGAAMLVGFAHGVWMAIPTLVR